MTMQTAPAVASRTATPQASSNKDRARYELQFYKTRQCSFYEKGKCTRGDKCKYAHGTYELQARPDLTFTSLCRTFTATGVCTDPGCSFAHNPEQLRATKKFFKTSLCKFHLNGRCRLGEECRHAHGEDELQALPAAKPAQVELSAPPGLTRIDDAPPGDLPELPELSRSYAASLLLNAAAAGGKLSQGGYRGGWPSSSFVQNQMPLHSSLEPAFIPLSPLTSEDAALQMNSLLSAASVGKSLATLAGLSLSVAPTTDHSPAAQGRVASWTTINYSSASSNSSFEELESVHLDHDATPTHAYL